MTTRILSFLFLVLFTQFCTAQSIQLSGYITDEATGEVLIGANVFVPRKARGTVTNEYGYYNLSVERGKLSIQFSYVGYDPQTLELDIQENQVLNVSLSPSSSLGEVVIVEERTPANRKGVGKIDVPISVLESIPVIGGENDLMKSLSLFPGISTGQEGSSGLFIRGGTPDQNLILLDGIPVYNANHLGGFFSVFNTHALNNVGVYKSNIPARYGGRLSSVIDITMREGNNQEFKGHFGIGALTSKLGLEGPIKKGKSSYLFTARTSYLGLVNLFQKKENTEFYQDYWLYDVNFKTNFNLEKGKLFFSVYTGNDIFSTYEDGGSYSEDFRGRKYLERYIVNNKLTWGNTTISTRYTQTLSPNIFAKVLLGFSQYRLKTKVDGFYGNYRIDTIEQQLLSEELTKNNDFIFRTDLDHTLSSNHLLKYGVGLIFHDFDISAEKTINAVSENSNESYQSSDYYFYLEDELAYGKFSANIGLRFSGFIVDGNHFTKLEPRIGVGLEVNDKTQLNSSFNTSRQYLHLLSPDGFGIPTDVWLPATQNTPPSDAFQITIGGNHKINKNWSFEVEGYYKEMKNLIINKQNNDPREVFTLNNWQDKIEVEGEGTSYGIEGMLKKELGRMTGFIGYTLSKTDRQFDNINYGERFLFDYDRRHDVSIVAQYKLSKHWTCSANWVYQTGRPVTLPVSGIPNENQPNSISTVFAGRNNARMPAYHRLDVGLENTKITKRGNTRLWKTSVYNAYNRINPSYLNIRDTTVIDNGQYLYSYRDIDIVGLFSIIPSVSYELKF